MPVLDADRVVTRLRAAFNHGAARAQLLAQAAELVREAGPPYTSVYVYMLHGDALLLEAHSGRDTEHTRIAVGHGVCGTAVATGEDQNVGDVRARSNYIACNIFTRSELVVLIRRGSQILGQIDIDSDVVDPFDGTEEHAVRQVADALAVLALIRSVRGIEFYEHRSGDGPEVVVLHGGPGAHHDYLLPGFDILARHRTLVYYDQRGGGRSPVGRDVPVGWREHVDDLEALRDVWGLERLDLCGYSWGALLAMLYAVTYPHRVASLALVSPAPAARRERITFEQNLARRNATPALLAERARLQQSGLRTQDIAAYNQRLFELAVSGYFHQPSRAHELTPFRITGRTQQAVWNSLDDDFDLRPALSRLQLPAIVVHGDDDPIPLETARETAEALHAPLKVLAGCGHVPYVEAPAEFFAALDPFLPRSPE